MSHVSVSNADKYHFQRIFLLTIAWRAVLQTNRAQIYSYWGESTRSKHEFTILFMSFLFLVIACVHPHLLHVWSGTIQRERKAIRRRTAMAGERKGTMARNIKSCAFTDKSSPRTSVLKISLTSAKEIVSHASALYKLPCVSLINIECQMQSPLTVSLCIAH